VREAIARKFERDNGLQYTAEQIVLSTGAKQSIANVILALINPGDEVLLPAPYWVSYSEMVKVAGGVPVVVPTSIDHNFKLTAKQLERAITPATRMMIYSSPCNPSGSVYTREELQQLADVLAQHPEVYLISDEIYELINFTGEHVSMASLEGMYDRTVTVNGVSKGFAMTGWRLGYLGAPLAIAKACAKIQGQFTSAPCGISQMAAKAAVEANPTSVDYMVSAFANRRDLVIQGLRTIDRLLVNVPEGAFYIFPDASNFFGTSYGEHTITNANDLCNYLLSEAHVALVTGAAFGAPECFRISYAASEAELTEAIARIKKALDQLK
jgi:aspartate aminotransferase